MKSTAGSLSGKLESLSADQIAEVEHFIEVLRHRTYNRTIVQASAAMSSSAFEAVWDNPEDAAYDAL